MRVCPLCQARYADDVRKCPYDGRRPLPEADVSSSFGDPLLGATLVDRFTIIGRLGAGGMGTVYRAEQAPMNREIALKILRKDLGRDPETVARFHREAQTLSALKHPNTVTIFDFGQSEDGLLYLAMELLEGEMLSSRLKRVGPMDVPLSIRIAAGVLRSLAEAHTRGIIHRDLKPDNIFLAKVHGRPDEDEMVKVVDFGIAKIRDGDRTMEPLQTQEGTVFGTPRYMSPEQAQGKTLDGRSDLYAVGVLLFHMLTGRPPFTDDDAVVVMAHHIKTVPPPVREAAPGQPIPESLERLVSKSLEKDPLVRSQTAEEFLAELEATLPEAKAMASAAMVPVVSRPERKAAPNRRFATWFAAGALALLAIVAGLAYGAQGHGAGRQAHAPVVRTSRAVQTVLVTPAAAAASVAAPLQAPTPLAAPPPEPTPPFEVAQEVPAPDAQPETPVEDSVAPPDDATPARSTGATRATHAPRTTRSHSNGTSTGRSPGRAHHPANRPGYPRWTD